MLNDNVEPNFTDKEVENDVSILIEADRQDISDFLDFLSDTSSLKYQYWMKLDDEQKFNVIKNFYRDFNNPIHRIIHTYFANQTTGRIYDLLEELIATNTNFNKAFEMLKVNSMLDAVKMIGSLMEEKS